MEDQTYNKGGGMGLHGGDYQIRILSLFVLEAFKKGEPFRLSTENKDAGKFDDVVLKTDSTTVFLQAKHKEDLKDQRSLITYEDIINPNADDFYLYKYLRSLPVILKNFGSITSLILCTNTTFTKNKKDKIKTYISMEEMAKDHIFYFSEKKFYYIFNENSKELLLKDKTSDITDDMIDLFLEKVQLVSIDDSDIDKRIECLIREIDIFNATVDTKHALMVLKEYIKNWLEDKKGNYIFLQHLGVFRSLHFVDELKQLDVEFNTKEEDTTKNMKKYTCVTIKNKDIAKIHLYKIYKQLKTEKVLTVDYNETTSRKKEVVSAFIINEFVYLIIPLFDNDYDNLKTAINNIAKTTFERKYKKIIFLITELDTYKKLSRDLDHVVDLHEDTIEFETFSENYQKDMHSRLIRFQEKDVQLKDIAPLPVINTIIDETILLNLIYKKPIIINPRYRNIKVDIYIPRMLYRFGSAQEVILYEENVYKLVSNESNVKTVLLADGPGMGKSTFLSHLQTVINLTRNLWITRINLNDYTQLFKTNATKTPGELLSLLVFDQKSKFIKFEQSLFNLQSNVILMLDAFDEVQDIYSNLILELIKYCESLDNVRKVIVTSRAHCISTILEVTINADVLSLKPFHKQSQIDYLYQYWVAKVPSISNNLPKCKYFVENLIRTINATIIEVTSLLEVPLHVQMIAEIFEEDCKTFVASSTCQPPFVEAEFDVAGLYERFIKKKKDLYVDERCKAGGNTEVELTMNKKFYETIEKLTVKALTDIFNDKQCKYFKVESTEEIALTTPLTTGILQELHGGVKFIHHSFAEYLVSRHIYDCMFVDEDVLDLYFSEVSCKLEYYMLVSFVNSIFCSGKIGDEPSLNTQMVAEVFEKNCLTFLSNSDIPEFKHLMYLKDHFITKKDYSNMDTYRVLFSIGAHKINIVSETESVIKKLMRGFRSTGDHYMKILRKRDVEDIAKSFTQTMDLLKKSDGVIDFILEVLAEYLSIRRICSCWSYEEHFIRNHLQAVYYSRWSYKVVSFLGKSTLKF